MVVDSGSTSHISTKKDAHHFIPTGESSDKVFRVANGNISPATEKRLLPFDLRPEAKEVHVAPGIVNASLLSTGVLADANYTTILGPGKVEIYDTNKTKITTSMEPIISGWQCPITKLHRIPLVPIHIQTWILKLSSATSQLLSSSQIGLIQQKHATTLVNSVPSLNYVDSIIQPPASQLKQHLNKL